MNDEGTWALKVNSETKRVNRRVKRGKIGHHFQITY